MVSRNKISLIDKQDLSHRQLKTFNLSQPIGFTPLPQEALAVRPGKNVSGKTPSASRPRGHGRKNVVTGFTLIELLIIIAVIAILAAVVFVALDPLTRFRDARDATRWEDAQATIDAIVVDQVDNGGAYMIAIDSAETGTYQIGAAAVGCDTGCSATTTRAVCINLGGLVTDGYLPEIPFDPTSGTAAETDYYFYKSAGGFVRIGACDPEGATAIAVTR